MVIPAEKAAHPTLDDLLAGLAKVSGHRQVLLRLNEFLSNDDGGLQDLVAILQMDPGLSARVISAANTAYFRGGLLAASVDEAVVRVGLSEVCRLLLDSTTYELTSGALRSYALAAGDLWSRSLACGIAMDMLARELRRSRDICHTIGLLHALGMIVVDRWLVSHELQREAHFGDTWSSSIAARERELVGFSNAELCARLLEVWRFPENIVCPIEHQETPLQAGRFSRLACLLVLARWLSHVILVGRNLEMLPAPPDKAVVEGAGFDEKTLNALIEPVRTEFAKRKASIGVF